MPDQLRDAINRAGDGFEVPSPDFRSVARRGRRRLWYQRMAATGAAAAVGLGAFSVAQLVDSTLRAPTATSPGSSSVEELSCSEQDSGPGGAFTIEWTTRSHVIASGRYEEVPWIFCAALATVTHRHDNTTENSLCTDWKFGPGLSGGWTCTNAFEHATTDYFLRSADTLHHPAGAYTGAVSDRVATVELHVEEEQVVEASIYEPPEKLGLDFNFFFGFTAEPNQNVVVKVLDSDSNVLAYERFGHLPR